MAIGHFSNIFHVHCITMHCYAALYITTRVYNREGGRVSYFTMVLCYNTNLETRPLPPQHLVLSG